MGKINREELFKILEDQYIQCKLALAANLDMNIHKLHNYQGDVIDIKLEISMGNTLEGSLFRSMDEDYYDKQKLLSNNESVPTPNWDRLHTESDNIWKRPTSSVSEANTRDIIAYGLRRSVLAPKHKKKYLIKLKDGIPQKRCEEIAEQIAQEQFIVYNQDTIEQIITLDVE